MSTADYKSYSPSKTFSQRYTTKTPPKYAEHRDATYNTTLSPYQTPNRDTYSRAGDETDVSENLSASKIRLDNQVRDIKTLLDTKYNPEIDSWRSKWQESEVRRNFLETENQRLIREIEFWKSKSSTAEIEKAQQLIQSEQLKNSQLETIRQTADNKRYSLLMEAERLRSLLATKIEECNEIKSNYSKLELFYAENADKDEVARDYEQRIQRLKNEYSDRLREVDDLKQQRNQLELESYELEKVQREQESLKNLLDSKREENTRLRREKTELEVENYKSKKAENALLEKEALLKSQIEELENEHANAEDLRKSNFLQKSMVHSNVHDELRKSFHAERTQLEDEVEEHVKLAGNKINEHDELRRSYHDLTTELAKAEDDDKIAEAELQIWKEKAAEAEKLKEAEVARANRLKEASIQLTISENLKEKKQLEERMDTLNKVLTYKEQDLNKVQEEALLTEAEKRQLEEERAKLQFQIDELIKKQEENDKRYQIQLKSKDNIHSYSVEKARKEHENEKRRISNQIQALRNVIDAKRDEAERARREANDFCLRLVNCENKAKQAEAEQQYWKNQTDRVVRQKSIEYQVEKELTNSQLREVERNQSIEKLQKLRETDTIRNIIDYQEREAQELRLNQSRAVSDLARERYEKIRNQTEAEINRSRALEAERSKYIDLSIKDQVHRDNVESMRRSGHFESSVLKSEANILADQLIRKDIEARDWRDNYTRLATSPYRKY
ncbi:hypothetical protein ABPG72_012495 [Tetrahymena utriculariae]